MAIRTELRFTDDAVDDLVQLQKKNRPALEWAMKKFVVIERNPDAGEPLGGALVGYRKLTISNRDWRVVWRTTSEESGTIIIDVGEIWAVGARKESEVYKGMRDRLGALPPDEQTKTLEHALNLLEAKKRRKKSSPRQIEHSQPQDAEQWQVDDLVNVAGYPEDVVKQLSKDQATRAWESFRSNER